MTSSLSHCLDTISGIFILIKGFPPKTVSISIYQCNCIDIFHFLWLFCILLYSRFLVQEGMGENEFSLASDITTVQTLFLIIKDHNAEVQKEIPPCWLFMEVKI